jgi:Right handed beta helix region
VLPAGGGAGSQNSADINFGGGIAFLGGKLTVTQSTIALNRAGQGGGIGLSANDGDRVRIERTTIADNLALDTAGVGASENGGGVYVTSDGDHDQRLKNVTITGNRAAANGAGIYLFAGTIKLNAVTVTANTADADEDGVGSGGGISGDNGILMRNSIVSGNLDLNTGNEDCGAGDSLGRNLFGLGTGCQARPSDLTETDAMLKPLGDYGGPTQTHALLKGSPAIGEARRKTAPKRDQRGNKRDKHPDIGAYER